jgi:hypothetical protein
MEMVQKLPVTVLSEVERTLAYRDALDEETHASAEQPGTCRVN